MIINLPEFPKELICKHSTEYRREIAQHRKGVVNHGRGVFGEMEL